MGLELRSQRVVEVVTDLWTDQRLLGVSGFACPRSTQKRDYRWELIVPLLLLHCACPELYGSLLINISDRFLTVKSAEKEIGKQDL